MKRIVWALNPFDLDREPPAKLARILRGYWPQGTIYPFYIGSRLDINLALAFDIPEEQRHSDYLFITLENDLTSMGLSDLAANARTMFVPTMSYKVLATKMCEYARSVEADVIAVSTHARSGIPRVALGSFTETLVHTSPISVFTVNPDIVPRDRLKRLLYASDLTVRAQAGFRRVLAMAERDRLDVILYHAVYPYPTNSVADLLDDEVHIEVEEAKLAVETLKQDATLTGLTLTDIWDQDYESIADRILHQAKKHDCDLIVVQAHAGPVEAMLLGSVSRKVIRESAIPVLILKI